MRPLLVASSLYKSDRGFTVQDVQRALELTGRLLIERAPRALCLIALQLN